MAQQRGEERHHRLRHPGHLDQQAEEHEQRHGEQDQMRHALVETAHEQQHGHVRGQHHVGEGGDREGDGDRHPRQHRQADDDHEEDHQVGVAQMLHVRVRQRRVPRGQSGQRDDAQGQRRGHLAEQPGDGDQDHQREAHRQRRRQPGFRHLQPRHEDARDLLDVFDRGAQHDGQKHQPGGGGIDFQRHRPAVSGAGGQRGHPHVLAAIERDGRADHAQPQEHRLRQLVGPDQRAMEDVTGDDAHEQDDDLRHHQQRRDQFQHTGQRAFQRIGPVRDGGLTRRGWRAAQTVHGRVSPECLAGKFVR